MFKKYQLLKKLFKQTFTKIYIFRTVLKPPSCYIKYLNIIYKSRVNNIDVRLFQYVAYLFINKPDLTFVSNTRMTREQCVMFKHEEL